MSANSRSAALVMVGGGGQDPGGGIGELPARGRPSRQSASQVTPLTLSCITCGGALPVATQPTRWPRYCSSACRQRAYRQRQAAAVAQDGGAGGARLAIPLAVDRFVGRDEELAVLRRRLQQRSRLITLHGPVGVGKTRLALELAARTSRSFADGSFLAELEHLDSAAAVLPAVAAAAGVCPQPGEPMDQALIHGLAGKQTLLVLDGCEQLAGASHDLILMLLRRCAGLQVLVTSRQTLGLPGETIFSLGGLPTGDAVELFADRARQAHPRFELSPHDAELAERLCLRLDGMPLAIEMAAGLVRLLPLTEIYAGLADRFELLSYAAGAGSPAPRDLLSSLSRSYQLLSRDEQQVLTRLGTYPGGFSLELAEHACRGLHLTAGYRQVIFSLESKSLLTASTVGGRVRFRTLETVRDFAVRQLADSDRPAAAASVLADWLTVLAAPLLTQVATTSELRARLDAEYHNLSYAAGQLSAAPDSRMLRLLVALHQCDPRADRPSADQHRADRLRHASQLAAALEVVTSPSPDRCLALATAAGQAIGDGEPVTALAQAMAATELACQLAIPALTCRCLTVLGHIWQACGDLESAMACLTECLELLSGLNQPDATALCLASLAAVSARAGDPVRAGQLAAQAAAVHPGAEPRLMAVHQYTAALVALADQAVPEAEDQFLACVRSAGPLPTPALLLGLEGLAITAAMSGRAGQALRLLGAADTLRGAIGAGTDPWWGGWLTRSLAAAKAQLPHGRAEAALSHGRLLTAEGAVACALGAESAAAAPPARAARSLTPREQQVAALVMQGLTNRQIATRLHLSERTVARHLDNIRTGLDLHTRAEIAAWNARQLIPVAGLGATPGTAGRRLLSGGLTGQNLRWLSRHLRWLSRWSWQWPGLLPGAAQ
jgi:predicted ATPase/DNA-binding CsgD family transcriptional regulator